MISHHHQTLFVHIPKCGGQSIEHAFLKALNLTWQNRAPLLLRPRVRGEVAPPRLAHLLLRDYIDNCYLSRVQYTNYFKFAVVRNPYERLISFYRYLDIAKRKGLNAFVEEDLTEILEPTHPNHWFFRPQVDYTQNPSGATGLDEVYHLEDLKNKWPKIAEISGLGKVVLPHINKSNPSSAVSSEKLSNVSRSIVRSLYSADFERFPHYDN